MPLTQQQARNNLKQLLEEYYNLSPEVIKSATESMVLGYIERLFRDVLGWPTEDINKFQHEKIVAKRKRVDRVLIMDDGDKIYIEAKRFGIIEELSDEWTVRPGQMALPGMATDRTQEEQQAINYAFENNGTWAILTNFERFRLFNARRDWLVFSFERPRGYEQDFELLWQLSWDNIHAGSLDVLSNQRWTKEVDTDYLAFINEQREQLAIDITLNRDKNAWAYDESGILKLGLLRTVVQRFLDRLVIVRFAEDHYVIPPGTLQQFYLLRTQSPYYTNELRQYLHDFFRRFDHVHNSALFALSAVDQAQFGDDVLLPLIDKLYEARYRAMPADIIGNTYEQYLGKALVLDNGSVKTRDNLETRKKQGSYYTPQVIVRYIVDNSLGRYLHGTHNGKPDGNPMAGETRKTAQDIRDLRILDSACGSGSFLIYAYQILAEFYQAEIQRLSQQHIELVKNIARNLTEVTLDDRVNAQRIENERDFIRNNYPRIILEKHIYGVDLDPQAAEIAVVNLMMRALERKTQDKRLPLILNQNIKVGNGLIGLRPDDPRLADHADTLATIRQLRAELIDTSNIDPRHAGILSELKTATDSLYAEFHADYAEHFTDLDRVHPFHWGVEFPEVFFDENGKSLDNAGFHFVFGNPPYGAKLEDDEKKHFTKLFNIGTTNTAALFMIQSLHLLRQSGSHGFIVPKSFIYSSTWATPRERLLDGLEILVDCGKVWDDVKLEQIIYLHRNDKSTSTYQNFKRNNDEFNLIENVEKDDCRLFEFYVNNITLPEIDVAKKMIESGDFLKKHITNVRGSGLQNDIDLEGTDFKIMGGANVQMYHLDGFKGYFNQSIDIPDNAIIESDSILIQNIVAHVTRPMPHIKIISHLVQNDESKFLILDTVNQVKITSNISKYFVLALLNSKLINWYVYRFIFAKAIRTMHFDSPASNRIPVPNVSQYPEIYSDIIEQVKKIYENRDSNIIKYQKKIDEQIFKLFDLSDKHIKLVEDKMP